MNQEKSTYLGPMVLTLIVGAAIGAVVVALTTPRTGRELRGELKAFGRRTPWKAGNLARAFRGVEAEAKDLDLSEALNDSRG